MVGNPGLLGPINEDPYGFRLLGDVPGPLKFNVRLSGIRDPPIMGSGPLLLAPLAFAGASEVPTFKLHWR